jgi:hypothetical protein
MQHITRECFLLKESGNSNSVTARSTALIKSSNNLTVFTNSYMCLTHTLKSLHSVHAVFMCVSHKSNSTREFNGQSCNGKGVCSLSRRSRTCPRCIIWRSLCFDLRSTQREKEYGEGQCESYVFAAKVVEIFRL